MPKCALWATVTGRLPCLQYALPAVNQLTSVRDTLTENPTSVD